MSVFEWRRAPSTARDVTWSGSEVVERRARGGRGAASGRAAVILASRLARPRPDGASRASCMSMCCCRDVASSCASTVWLDGDETCTRPSLPGSVYSHATSVPTTEHMRSLTA